jgi:hypothetical protein
MLLIHLWNPLCAYDERVMKVNSILRNGLISKFYFLQIHSTISVYFRYSTPPESVIFQNFLPSPGVVDTKKQN